MINNGPENNFKLLIWTLTGLVIACFLLLAGPGRVFAGEINTQSVKIKRVSYDKDGNIFVEWEPFNDLKWAWEWDGSENQYRPWNTCGGNYFKFSDQKFFTDWVEPLDIPLIAEASQDPDFDPWHDCITKTYPAGVEQRFYLQQDVYHNDYVRTEEQLLEEVLKKSDDEMDGITSDTVLEAYSWLGDDEGDFYTGKVWELPKIAEIITPPDGAENLSWPEDFTITWENIPAEYDQFNLILLNEYYTTGRMTKNIGTATTTTSGTTTITAPQSDTSELGIGPYYASYWIKNSATGEKISFSNDYRVEFGESFEVTLPRPEWEIATDTAENFYDDHSDYATPTPAFDVIFDSIEPFYGWVENISEMFQDKFDPGNAFDRGKEMGKAIATGRAYAGTLDDFFGLPVSWALMIYIFIGVAIIVFRLISGLVDLVKP